MTEGSIVMVAFNQHDGAVKQRPALLLKFTTPFNDVLACAISSKLHNHVEGVDVILKNTDSDFHLTGLKHNALIRTTLIQTFSVTNHIVGAIGKVNAETYNRVVQNLINYLKS